MAKHDEAELELLGNLFNFIKKKHSNLSISSIEAKFGKSARELVDIGEISEATLVEFCDIEGIDIPKKKEKPTKSETTSSSSYGRTYSDPCGGSSRSSSGC